MKDIRGYICVARDDSDSTLPRVENLFGKPLHGGYAYLEATGLTPYASLNEALDVSQRLNPLYDFVREGLLNMHVAESLMEARGLSGSSFVVVVGGIKAQDVNLVGPYVRGRPDQRPLPGARLGHNCLQTFSSIDDALRVSDEISRMTHCPAPIASFRLNYIDST